MSRPRRRERYVKKAGDNKNPFVEVCKHTGKLRFPSRKVARRFAASRDLHGLNAYECSVCGSWHLGHPPKMVRDGDAVRWEMQPRVEETGY